MRRAAPLSPPETAQEQLTRQFYEWEKGGRGWQLWEEPIEIEPAFQPFFGHFTQYIPGASPDDGRKPHFFRSLADRFNSYIKGDSPADPPEPMEEPEPDRFEDTSPLVEIHISLPSQTSIGKDASEQFLMS